ncbi:hypothetical protein GGI20_004335 [Coemansia sp. BCRC 34301]|nr:hypothetical protein GGI20_004335 [Coemansia sp. BCRC 34301]
MHTATTTTSGRDDVYLARSLDICERQLSETVFSEPLDAAQVRRLVNIERIVAEFEKAGRQQQSSKYQERAEDIVQQLRPWIEKRDALLSPPKSSPDGDESVELDQPLEELRTHAADDDDDSKSESQQPTAHAKPDLKRRSSLAERREELLGEMEGLRRRGQVKKSYAKTNPPYVLYCSVVPNSVEGVERLLKSQRATQEELTSDLVQMASVLKKNSVAFGDLLEKDKTVVEETSDLLNRNVAGVSGHGARLNKYRKRAWGTTGLTWLMISVVVSVFFLLVLFMRIAPKRY